MNKSRRVRVAIVGSGPAGWTAAIYTARAMMKPVMICGLQVGGQMTITTDVENYPGFSEVIQGPWLMDQMKAQAEACGTDVVEDVVVSADLSVRPFRLQCDSGTVYETEVLIIATGAQAKWLGLESEQKYRGFGVSACATCDGFFYCDKEVAVVGGGNTAVEEALFLTKFASRVTLIHRRDELRCERILQDRLFANNKIRVLWNTCVDEVLGIQDPQSVKALKLSDLKTGEQSEISVDGLFIAIGHTPSSEVFKKQLTTNEGGYIRVKPGTAQTGITGVFAAGDVTDDVYRQAVTAAGMGCMAALEAIRLLAEEDHARVNKSLPRDEVKKIGAW
jgi:thioredoxin reductase (NADPH)